VRLHNRLLDDRRRRVREDDVAGLDFRGGEVANQFIGGGDAFAQEDVDFLEEVALGEGFGLGGVDFDDDLGRGLVYSVSVGVLIPCFT